MVEIGTTADRQCRRRARKRHLGDYLVCRPLKLPNLPSCCDGNEWSFPIITQLAPSERSDGVPAPAINSWRRSPRLRNFLLSQTRPPDAAVPACAKKESYPLRDMGADLGMQRL
jgi:hypothetical protein